MCTWDRNWTRDVTETYVEIGTEGLTRDLGRSDKLGPGHKVFK